MGMERNEGERDQDRRWRLVVGLDGSENSQHAMDWAIKLAKPLDAEVVAIHAVNPLAYAVTPTELDEETRRRMQTELEDVWCEPLRRAGVRFRARFELGRAADILRDVAREEGAEAIVVGRRGRGAISEALLGSVSHELGHRATTPVVIVEPSS